MNCLKTKHRKTSTAICEGCARRCELAGRSYKGKKPKTMISEIYETKSSGTEWSKFIEKPHVHPVIIKILDPWIDNLYPGH